MNPQSSVRFIKGILILEVIGVLGAYTLYFKMNSSEAYYKSNEWAGIYGLKEMDEEKWLTKKP
ncbi:hypothetical protein E2320_018800 [Naja naja]|nr:hypothetical protein E2320_018800 [Naja naja]